jgi:hypothetical protein
VLPGATGSVAPHGPTSAPHEDDGSMPTDSGDTASVAREM